MRYSSRFFLYAPVALLLLLAISVMVWWKISASSFDARLAADNGREIMPGVHMHFVAKSIGGFPFRIDSVFDGFSLEVQTRTGPLVWHAEHFAMHALTYGPNRQVFEAAGVQTLTWTDSDGVHHRYSFVPGSLRASASILDHHLARFDVDAVAINSPVLTGARVQFHMRQAPGHDALDFAVSGDNLRLASEGSSQLTEQSSISGTLAPAVPLAALMGGKMDWRNAAESWRLDGGKLLITNFEALQGRIRTSGSGTLSLDSSHRLQGRVALSYDAPPSARNLGTNPKPEQPRYYWSIRSGNRDSQGRPQMTYVLSDGHVYLNSIGSSHALDDWSNSRQAFLVVGTSSEMDQAMKRLVAVIRQHAIVLHPIY